MPKKQEELNNDLFQLLKIKGYEPVPFTSDGKQVPTPFEADVFQFRFNKDGKDYGPVTVTVDGSNDLGVYYSDDVAGSPKSSSAEDVENGGSSGGDPSWYQLLKQLKVFAKNHQLGFDLKDQDNLKYDMATRERTKKLSEGYHAINKKASYNDNIAEVKMVIKHKREMQEGEQRYRQIDRIFIENVDGERFLAPTNKPGLARVYARHIAEGGKANDDRWNHINNICEEYSKMAGFVRATKNGQFNESAQKLVNEGINHYTKLRETLHKMAGKKGYNAYFESYTPQLMEDEEQVDLSEMFKSSSLDPRIESVMPILSKLNKNISEGNMKEIKALEEWADNIVEADEGIVSNNPQGIPEEIEPEQRKIDSLRRSRLERERGGESELGPDPDPVSNNGMKIWHFTADGEPLEKDGRVYYSFSEAEVKKILDFLKNKAATVGDTSTVFSAVAGEAGKQGVAEGSIGDKIKGAAKSVKRAAQGWGAGGESDAVSPKDVVQAFGKMDGQRLANFVASRKDFSKPRKKSARAFADRVIDREMKQRGYGRVAGKDEQGVAEGLSKRDQKDVDAIKAAIERLQAQLKQPNADKESIQQSIAHEKKRLALYGKDLAEDKGMTQYNAFKREWRAKHGSDAKVPGYDSKEYTSYIYRQGDKKKGVAENEKKKMVPTEPWWTDDKGGKNLNRRPADDKKKQQGAAEDLDSNQKSVDQLGPTEKITKSNPLRGKLVGANESIEMAEAQDTLAAMLRIVNR